MVRFFALVWGAMFFFGSHYTVSKDDPVLVTVVVAKQKLDMGTLVRMPEQYFEAIRRPIWETPAGALRFLDEAKGKQLKRRLSRHDVVTEGDFFVKGGSPASSLPEGHLAVGFRASVPAEWRTTLINKRVKVLALRGLDRDYRTEVVVGDALLLACDTVADECGHVVVTLALLPEDVARIHVAREAAFFTVAEIQK